MCDVCFNESGGLDVGVAAVPGAPMSIMWCNKCLRRDAVVVPDIVADYFLESAGGIDGLNQDSQTWLTWSEGKYMTIREYAARQAEIDSLS
jgi:hypothetical protein